jgi:hypothetical protein
VSDRPLAQKGWEELMSVWSKRIGGLMVASIVIAAVAGCGGNGGSVPPNPTNNVVQVDGGVVTQEGSVLTGVAATDSPQTIEVDVNGTTTQATVPAGIAVTAGEPVAVIPANTLLLNGLQGGADRDPGAIIINGKPSGARVVNGRIRPALALPAGHYDLLAEGPFSVRQGANVLTIQQFLFHFDSNGHVLSLPIGLTGAIPANSSNNWTNSVTATFASAYASGNATLRITHLNGVLQRTVTIVGNTATFTDFANDQQSQIPAQGVETVEFTH